MQSIARLNSADLPPQFSYRPYIPSKRMSTTKTANAVIVQYASPSQIVYGEDLLSFKVDGAYACEFQDLYDLYNTDAPVLYTFEGYWGEVLAVYFVQLDNPTVRSTLFDVSGAFQVMCVTTEIDAACPSGCA